MIYKLFSCLPNISRVGYKPYKPIESVVYCLNNFVDYQVYWYQNTCSRKQEQEKEERCGKITKRRLNKGRKWRGDVKARRRREMELGAGERVRGWWKSKKKEQGPRGGRRREEKSGKEVERRRKKEILLGEWSVRRDWGWTRSRVKGEGGKEEKKRKSRVGGVGEKGGRKGEREEGWEGAGVRQKN